MSVSRMSGALRVLLAIYSVGIAQGLPGSSPAIPGSPTGQPPPAPGQVNGSYSGGGGVSSTLPPSGPGRPQTQRALAVLVLVSAAVIVFFVIRTIRTRRTNRKTRKYGVLDTNIGNMELTPLEQEDEEDDTLFDANNPRR